MSQLRSVWWGCCCFLSHLGEEAGVGLLLVVVGAHPYQAEGEAVLPFQAVGAAALLLVAAGAGSYVAPTP